MILSEQQTMIRDMARAFAELMAQPGPFAELAKRQIA